MTEPGRQLQDYPEAQDVMAVLARQVETGTHLSEAEIARELGRDVHDVTETLRTLAAEGPVVRTEAGNWELTPAAQSRTEPRPDPKEPSS